MSSPIIPLLVCFVLVHIHVLQGYIQIAKCSVALGDLSAVDSAISVVKELSPNNAAIIPEVQKLEVIRRFDEEANKAYQKQDYRKVIIFCEIFVL